MLSFFMLSSPALGFVPRGLEVAYRTRPSTSAHLPALLDDRVIISKTSFSQEPDLNNLSKRNNQVSFAAILPALAVLTTCLPAEAAAPVPSALWAYAHYLSIIAIFGCLSAEKTLVKVGMTEEEEATVVKLDLVYGVMAALL